MASWCLSSSLSANAPLFVPRAALVAHPAAPVIVSYAVPPDLLPPVGMPCPFMGPPPPPGFVSVFHGLPPSGGFPCPVQGPPPPQPGFCGPPPPPGFPTSSTFLGGFLHDPAVGMPPPMPTPHAKVVRPAVPAGVKDATQPEQTHLKAAVKDADKAAAGLVGTGRAASVRRRPKNLSPLKLLAAKLEPVVGGNVGHGAAMGGQSPCSVLHCPSPPALPAAFPFPSPSPSSALCRSVPPRGQPVRPLPPKQASVPRAGVRPGRQRPRRLFDPADCETTLMIRNIPNGFTRQKVMNIIDQHCAEENAKIALAGDGGVKSEYDFLYVPFDFRSRANKGYCFVNATTPDAAFRLWQYLHGYRWKANDSRKMCEVDYADIQGRQKLVAHFSTSSFDCDTEEFLPVWFSPPRNGARPAVFKQHVVGRLVRHV